MVFGWYYHTDVTMHCLAPSHISEHFWSLRSIDLLHLVVPRTGLKSAGDRDFAAMSPNLWNSLDILSASGLVAFRFLLKTHIGRRSSLALSRVPVLLCVKTAAHLVLFHLVHVTVFSTAVCFYFACLVCIQVVNVIVQFVFIKLFDDMKKVYFWLFDSFDWLRRIWLHKSKMAASVFMVFWLHFYIIEGRGDAMFIIYIQSVVWIRFNLGLGLGLDI